MATSKVTPLAPLRSPKSITKGKVLTATHTSTTHRLTKPHILFIDGIRGIAALYVVLHHTWLESAGCLPVNIHHALGFLSHGRFAVSVFIVLSGYVLMKPLAESKDGKFKHGIGNYFKRRALRILPPYYAALAVSIALIMISKAWHLTASAFESVLKKSLLILLKARTKPFFAQFCTRNATFSA